MTLIVFLGEKGASLYMVPAEQAEPYNECHGCILNYNEEQCPGEVGAKTEHLAYMLGEEVWYGDGAIPPLPDFLERVKKGSETADSKILRNTTEPPWKQFRIQGPAVDFSRVHRLINCGWLM